MTDVDALGRWLDRYAAAWKSNDPDQIGALFTDDAVYRWHPYDDGDDVAHGREAILRAWLAEPDDPDSWDMTYGALAVNGDLGVARCVTTYADRKRYHNIFLVRLDDEGRCSDFVEYFMKVPSAS